MTIDANSKTDFAIPLKFGLIGGLVAVSIALQGMIQAFSVRDIVTGVLSMSQMLLLVTFFSTAYVSIAKTHTSSTSTKFIVGGLAGLVASALLVLLMWLGNFLPLGTMFVNVTAELNSLLTWKQGLAMGSVILLVLGFGAGVVAAGIGMLPQLWRSIVINTSVVIITMGVLKDLIYVTFSDWPLVGLLIRFIYLANGLSVIGAIIVTVICVAVLFFSATRGQQIQARIDQLPPTSKRTLRFGSIGLGIVILLALPWMLGLFLSEVLDNVGLFLLMGLGLNIVVGFAGLLDLGYVAFYAIGAYTVGVLTSPELSTGVVSSWWIALPFAVIAATLAGVTLGVPVLKMRGDYLAIVTLGFGEIIRILAISDFLKPWLGGAQGIQRIAVPDLPLLQINWNPQTYYYLFLAGCLLVIFVASRVKNSRMGRAWMAMREDEDVAQAMGINLVATKLLAFGMGASFGGLAGAIFASKLTSAYPHSFNFLVSINVLSLIIIGGMGSIPGVIVGALALVGLPELLREFAEFRYLIYGVVLVVMMLVRPEGLIPEARRAEELEEFRHAEEPPPEELAPA
jgi:branched-chain amino acid transport system permease protein